MKYLIDSHTHTVASGHAYSTLIENARAAAERGLKILAVTDHGPAMPGGPHRFYFGNLKVVPRYIDGVMILRGIEANITDADGDLDMPDKALEKLDLVIASLHDVCIRPGTAEQNTAALINVMNNRHVDIIGHPGNPEFEIDIDAVLKKAKEKDVLIEINNSSFVTSRAGSYRNCLRIAQRAAEIGVNIIAGTDSHICFDIGVFDEAEEVIKKAGVPDSLIMNLYPERFTRYLIGKGKLADLKQQPRRV